MKKMKLQTKEKRANPLTGALIPLMEAEKMVAGIDEEYFYCAVPNHYIDGVPVVMPFRRSHWEIVK